MMTETQQFILEILEFIPVDESVLIVQSPHEEVLSVLRIIVDNKKNDFETIKFSKKNRKILIEEIKDNGIEEYIHRLEVLIKDKKVFEGYDGMEYAMFSKEFNLPKEFKEKYTKMDMCMISEDW